MGRILRPAAENHCVELPDLYAAYARVVTGAGKEAHSHRSQRLRKGTAGAYVSVGDRVFLEGVQLARVLKR